MLAEVASKLVLREGRGGAKAEREREVGRCVGARGHSWLSHSRLRSEVLGRIGSTRLKLRAELVLKLGPEGRVCRVQEGSMFPGSGPYMQDSQQESASQVWTRPLWLSLWSLRCGSTRVCSGVISPSIFRHAGGLYFSTRARKHQRLEWAPGGSGLGCASGRFRSRPHAAGLHSGLS